VWKKTEVPATPAKLRELESFTNELTQLLELAGTQ
jgi:hypothetical protein